MKTGSTMAGVFAFLDRTLRVDLQRFSFWGTIAMLTAVNAIGTIAIGSQFPFGSPGDAIFRFTLGFGVFYVWAITSTQVATAIPEEREEGTLGLLRLTPTHPAAILFGKIAGRLIGRLLVLMSQVPFLLLAVSIGGVENRQVFLALGELVGLTLFFVAVGALCSVMFRKGKHATTVAFLAAIAYMVVPWLLQGATVLLAATPVGPRIGEITATLQPFFFTTRAGEIMAGSPPGGGPLPGLGSLFVAHIIGSIVLFVIASIRFERIRHFGTEVEKPSKKGTTDKTRPSREVPAWGIHAWREFVFGAGGVKSVVTRLIAYPLFCVGLTAIILLVVKLTAERSMGGARNGGNKGDLEPAFGWSEMLEAGQITLGWLLFIGGIVVILIEFVGAAARVFRADIQERTWQTLYLTPGPILGKVVPKVLGATILPVVMLSIPLLGIAVEDATLTYSDVIWNEPFAWIALVLLGLCLSTVVFSLYFKQTAAAIAIVAFVVAVIVFSFAAIFVEPLQSKTARVVLAAAYFLLPLLLVPGRLRTLARTG